MRSPRVKRLFINDYSDIKNSLETLERIASWQARQQILANPGYHNSKALAASGYAAYSQGDEDGIIAEIFRRIGIETRSFIEIGAGKGLVNNTAYLLAQGWRGAWIEGSKRRTQVIKSRFAPVIESGRLRVKNAYVDRDNVNELIRELTPEREVDLFSLDIDGNDYHIVKALRAIAPRVFVAEYNAKFAPPVEWVMKYNATHQWDGTDYYGASLKSYEKLFHEKGYALVGCTLTGVNAFYVRQDLVADCFKMPFTAEMHYEPARHFLIPGFKLDHPPNFGEPAHGW